MPLTMRYAIPLIIAVIVAYAGAGAAEIRENLSAVDLFALADRARVAGRLDDAQAIFDALIQNPEPEVRAEARFREGMMFADAKRYRQAAVLFRALLDEKPGATRVRLELARVLAAIGDEPAARRELRQAEAAGLPAEVALAVDQFASALRSRKRLGGSLELALAPDSNINRATDAHTLDTVIAPLTLSRDARRQAGVGLRVSGQAYARLPLSDDISLVPRLSGLGDIYRHSAFDDLSGSALLGVEWQRGRDRFVPSIGETWRWYGRSLYARTRTVDFGWLHPSGTRGQFNVQADAGHADYVRNALQSGELYSLATTYERAFGARSGGTIGIDGARQAAHDPGYSTWSGGGSVLMFRTIGRSTIFATAGLHRLVGDARLFLFTDRRREWLLQISGGGTFRQLTVGGFAPIVRVSFERNSSTVRIYDYRRISTQLGITRAF